MPSHEVHYGIGDPISAAQVLARTNAILHTTQHGLTILLGDDLELRKSGLYIVAVFGRSITLSMQHMRSFEEAKFNSWYAPFEKMMGEEPLFQFFNRLRTTIVHAGAPEPWRHSTHPQNEGDSALLAHLAKNQPPGTTRLVINDDGIGWMNDYTGEHHIAATGKELGVTVTLHLFGVPTSYLGKTLTDTSLQHLASLYVENLTETVHAFRRHFGLS